MAFKIVHPDLVADQNIMNTLKLLGAKELTYEHIQNILRTKEIPNVGRKWGSLPDDPKNRENQIMF